MNELQVMATTLILAIQLKAHESWCGETSLQKATFALQELFGIKTGFDFVLYKKGPYSFAFRDHLAELKVGSLLQPQQLHPGYAPSLVVSGSGKSFLEQFPQTLRSHEAAIEVVARYFGPKDVHALERLATALYVSSRETGWDAPNDLRARKLIELKPHISEEDALAALTEVDALHAEALALA